MAVDTMKLKAREELQRIYLNNTGEYFNKLSSKQQSLEATRFFIKEILNQQRTGISDEDIDDGTVDGADDLGCDFIWRDDAHVIIIQSKYRIPSATELPSDITHFLSILKRLTNPKLKPNSRLKPILSEIDWEHDTFELIFIAFSRMDSKSQARIISINVPDYPAEIPDLDKRSEWNFYDESDLNEALRSARELSRGVSDRTTVLYPDGHKGKRGMSVLRTESGGYDSYIMTLDASQIAAAYKSSGRDALFSLNIRNYIGNTRTNKEMLKTLEEDPSRFFLFNNGISCLATQVLVSDEKIEVKGLQVINGAQTVKSIVQTSKDIERLKKGSWHQNIPNVLVRITEIPEGYGTSGRIRELITQYNNTQNTIKVSDFRSNDPVQKALMEQFSLITRKGKKVVYLPKRTDRVPSNSEVIRLEEFSKAAYTFLHDFTAFSGSSTFLFNDENSGGYAKVFGDGLAVWSRMPDEEFRIRAAIYWISQEVSLHLKTTRQQQSELDARSALERKWVVLFAFGIVMRRAYPNDSWRLQLQKLYKGDWSFGVEKRGEIVLKIYNLAISGVIVTYRNNKKYDKGFVHRNWMRSKSTPASLKEIIEDSVMVNQHIDEIPT